MIYIRTDANPDIGLGHIMRCLSIADAAMSSGESAMFILADRTVRDLVEKRGYRTFVLNSDYRNMEGELKAWPQIGTDIIIVDSYHVTVDYLTVLRRQAKLVYIDDLVAFPYPADALINYNIFSTSEDYKKLYKESNVEIPQLIIGPHYAPLRTMFRNIPPRI